MTQHVATKRETKIGFERIGVIVAVLILMAVAVIVISTMMAAVGGAANPNTPSADARTSAIQDAKRPPT